MRGGTVIQWCKGMGVAPDDLMQAIRALLRRQEDLRREQMRLLDVHGVPDIELDEHLMHVERHMGLAIGLVLCAIDDSLRELRP
jgi:hypothetical protein